MWSARCHTSIAEKWIFPIASLAFLLTLGACHELPVHDGWYSCDPAVSGACPAGLSCVWSAEAGEYRCLSSDPSPDAGTDGGGETCGPGTCAGCCDRFGLCRNGAEDPRCGAGGQDCVDCVAQSRTCVGGVCQGSTCDCTTGACCDGCYFRPASYLCDPSPVSSEQGCAASGCGADAQQRDQLRYCTGTSADCTSANLVWGSWSVVDDCDTDQICEVSAGVAQCVTCPQGCAGGQCTSETCGDTTCTPPNEDTCTCPTDCGSQCGDGCCNGGETASSCAQDCGGATCTNEGAIACGDSISASLAGADDTLSGYSCDTLVAAEDHIYTFVAPTTGQANASFDINCFWGTGDNLDLYVMEGACDPSACVVASTNVGNWSESADFDVIAGQTYYLAVELRTSDSLCTQDYTLTLTCP